MTRKQAIHKSIELLSKTGQHYEIITLLQEISDELPLIHWTDHSIRDTIEQFICDNGRPPTVSDFKKRGMPPHTVIKQKYKITLAEWLSKNYPSNKPSKDELKEKYTALFIEDYLMIKPKTQEEFNKNRRAITRGWQTVAAYNNVKSWNKLIRVLELPTYNGTEAPNSRSFFQVNIINDYDFRD